MSLIDILELFTNDKYTIPSGIFGTFTNKGELNHKEFECFKCGEKYSNIRVGNEPTVCRKCGRKMLWK